MRVMYLLFSHTRAQVADALSALKSVAGAVRVTRFDHSSLSGYDSTEINTAGFRMEYIMHFEGVGRPDDLPLLSYGRLDSVNCGKMKGLSLCDTKLRNYFWQHTPKPYALNDVLHIMAAFEGNAPASLKVVVPRSPRGGFLQQMWFHRAPIPIVDIFDVASYDVGDFDAIL